MKKDYKIKILVGGRAMNFHGSVRITDDTDYLINDPDSKEMFFFDQENNIDYLNANGDKFFAKIYKIENQGVDKVVSPASLLELKSRAFVDHCLGAFWAKADEDEADMKYLARKFDLTDTPILKKYISTSEYGEVIKVLKIRR